jgi:hypothetical protein
VAAPLVLEALQRPAPALAVEQAAAVPRFLTAAEQAAVDEAFGTVMKKAKVRRGGKVCGRLCAGSWLGGEDGGALRP